MAQPTGDPVAELARELRADVPPAVAALPRQHVQTLLRALRAEQRRQHDAVDQAIDDGLKYVPGPLRRVVQKVLFG